MKIDFEQLYRAFILPRLSQAEGLKEEDVEALSDRWYEEFNHTPNAALGGRTPCEYYDEFSGPELMELAWEYWQEGEELPQHLAHALVHQGEETAAALFRLLERALPKVRGEMLELLCQMQYAPLLETGFEKILTEAEEEETQLWVEAVLMFGAAAGQKALEALPGQEKQEVIRILADIASQYPGEGAMEQIAELFAKAETQDLAFYASCLGRMGDERAVEILTKRLNDPKLDYYTYCAIRDAAEELGALVEIDREFAGDKDYETIKLAMDEMEREDGER
ncbi:MAG: hypothetical protein ACLUR9_01140 [Christensenellales bacterium]